MRGAQPDCDGAVKMSGLNSVGRVVAKFVLTLASISLFGSLLQTRQ